MIALVLGGSIWGYFKFVQNRSLVLAGTRHIVDKSGNRDAQMAYSHKLRETHFGAMNRIRGDLQQFFNDVISKKKYSTNDAGPFEQRYTELVAELRDHVEEFDQLMVPEPINGPHIKISHSHKWFYEALIVLRKGFYDTEKDVQKTDYADARSKFNAGWKEDLDGEAGAHSALENRLI